jgi:hypothetical protein
MARSVSKPVLYATYPSNKMAALSSSELCSVASGVEFVIESQSMAQEPLVICFPDLDKREASQYAQDLAAELKQMGVQKAERQRDDVESQDFGATLILVLGTASVTAIATGVAAWLKRNGTKVEIKKPDGTRVVVSNTDSGDIAKIVKAISI